MLDGLTFPRNFDRGRRGHVSMPADVEELARRIQDSRESFETTGDVVGFMLTELRNNPAAVLKMAALKIVRSWYATDSMLHETPIALLQIIYLALIVSGAWLAWRRYLAARLQIALILLLALDFWAMTFLVLSILRYMVPVMGLLLIFGALALDLALSRTKTAEPLPARVHDAEPVGR